MLQLESMASSLDLLAAELDDAPNAPQPFRAPLRFVRLVVRRLMGRLLGRQTQYNHANYELARHLANRLPEEEWAHMSGPWEGASLREELLGHDALILQAVKKHLETLAGDRSRRDAEIASQLGVLSDRVTRIEEALGNEKRVTRAPHQTGPR